MASACQRLGEDLATQQRRAVTQNDRAEAWKGCRLGSLCLLPVALVILRFFRV
jgi:hypothetical protein